MSDQAATEEPSGKPRTLPTTAPSGRPAPGFPLLQGTLVAAAFAAAVALALHYGPAGKVERGTSVRAIAKRLDAKRRPRALAALRAACAKRDCACVKTAANLGLDADATDAVLELVARSRSCTPPELAGVRAEALVRNGDSAGARAAATVLERSPQDPNALYAVALAHYREQKLPSALVLAESSERAGRGWSATLLTGLIAYGQGDFARARRSFGALLEDNPDDVEALFNLGVTAQRENRYGEARSSYLRVTRLDPRHADARYNLALLTHSFGALGEAQHHLQKFQKIARNDARVAELRAALAKPPEHGPARSP